MGRRRSIEILSLRAVALRRYSEAVRDGREQTPATRLPLVARRPNGSNLLLPGWRDIELRLPENGLGFGPP